MPSPFPRDQSCGFPRGASVHTVSSTLSPHVDSSQWEPVFHCFSVSLFVPFPGHLRQMMFPPVADGCQAPPSLWLVPTLPFPPGPPSSPLPSRQVALQPSSASAPAPLLGINSNPKLFPAPSPPSSLSHASPNQPALQHAVPVPPPSSAPTNHSHPPLPGSAAPVLQREQRR